MKILLLGDLHGDVDTAKKIVAKTEVDYALQVGDMTVYASFDKPTYFIYGNHEDFNSIKSLYNGSLKLDNLKLLRTSEVIVLQKNGDTIRVSGINGNYSPTYKERERHFTKKDIEECKKLRNINIFLSHEAPAGIGVIHPRLNKDVGVEPVKEIMEYVKPRFLIFGHHHFFFEKKVGSTQVYGLDYARREHYILDTKTNLLERMKHV